MFLSTSEGSFIPNKLRKKHAHENSKYIQLFISCRNLRNADVLSLSDPMCALFMKNPDTGEYHELGRTNMLRYSKKKFDILTSDTLNPDFPKSIVVNRLLLRHKELRFVVIDIDSFKRKDTDAFIGNDDILGVVDWKIEGMKKNIFIIRALLELLKQKDLQIVKPVTVRTQPYGVMIIQGTVIWYRCTNIHR